MSLAWVVYCVAVAVLIGLAAWAGESAWRGMGRPVRWHWAAALLGSVVLPVLVWRGWLAHPGWLGWSLWGGGGWTTFAGATPFASAAVPSVPAPGSTSAWAAVLAALSAALRRPSHLDRVLLASWISSSGVMLIVIMASVWRLRRARSGWCPAVVDGVRVLVSPAVGPAVVGVVRSAIVIPAWALGLEPRWRRLMLLHEAEHLRAGDPRLLVAGLCALVLMPWNPVLWWQFRRLRQALELDCDARVLRREPDARSYGLLLLEVGRRQGAVSLAITGLADSRPFLERRIRMLGNRGMRFGRIRLSVGIVVAAALVLLACEAREPVALDRETAEWEVIEVAPSEGAAPAAALACSPAFIVDGEALAGQGRPFEALSRLDSADIESVEVVKGSAAAAMSSRWPGVDASCGLVMIITNQRSTQ